MVRGLGSWGCAWSSGVMFSFNSIKGNGKWMGNEREMENVIYIYYRSCLVVNFLFFKGQNTGEWGCVPVPGFYIYLYKFTKLSSQR